MMVALVGVFPTSESLALFDGPSTVPLTPWPCSRCRTHRAVLEPTFESKAVGRSWRLPPQPIHIEADEQQQDQDEEPVANHQTGARYPQAGDSRSIPDLL